MTSGCTQEACDFRDIFPNFKKLESGNCMESVLDPVVESHKKFERKYNLPFTLT